MSDPEPSAARMPGLSGTAPNPKTLSGLRRALDSFIAQGRAQQPIGQLRHRNTARLCRVIEGRDEVAIELRTVIASFHSAIPTRTAARRKSVLARIDGTMIREQGRG